MERTEEAKRKPPLLDQIYQLGTQAFDPAIPVRTREPSVREFHSFLKSKGTLVLLPVLNLLIQPDRAQPWLRQPILAVLARLPLRPQGVQNTIEFILSVHPSTVQASTEGKEKNGTGRPGMAGISHEALNAASRLLSSPPVDITPDDWFQGIAPQLLSLLGGEGQPGMDNAAAFVIGFGILGRRQYGAPGKPGWNAFVVPVLRSIDPTITPKNFQVTQAQNTPKEDKEVMTFHKVLVTSQDLEQSLQRLSTLLSSHPHPTLAKRLLQPVYLPLWSLSRWSMGDERIKGVCKPARSLLKIFLQLSVSQTSSGAASQIHISGPLSTILKNLTFNGRTEGDHVCWVYNSTKDGSVQIEAAPHSVTDSDLSDLATVDVAVDAFISLLTDIPELESDIPSLFIDLCTKWLAQSTKEKKILEIVIRVQPNKNKDNFKSRLIEAKVLQKMITEFPDKLVSDSRQVLHLVEQVLSEFTTSPNGYEDIGSVALSLLNIVLTSPSFRPTTAELGAQLNSIQASLQSLSKRNLEISSTAQNLLLLLKFKSIIDESNAEVASTPTDIQLEDRKTYNLAISYLTTLDSPPPIRAQGLELLSSLVRTDSAVLDIPSLLVLFTTLLQDSEEYIYLRAIQSIIQLSRKHPKAILKDLIDRYVDPNEDCELDQRLRLGEALLQVIQSNHQALGGEISQSVCEGLLFVAGRRGHRPATERKQEYRNKLKRKKHAEAEEAWGGEVPQLDEEMDVKSQEDYNVLLQIITGWESKRGAEDVRMRTSALSILGQGMEANIEGIGSHIVSSAIDLSIHILTLETDPEKGILRRAAIRLIMSFVKALDLARADGKKVGFGFVGNSLDDVQRILEYISATDNDGKVQDDARDVVESLVAWQMKSLFPCQKEDMELRELAGLSITPRGIEDPDGSIRPRIEEIE